MIPGHPAHGYELDGDDQAFADWMLEMIERDPNRVAMIGVRRSRVLPRVDEMEDGLRRAFNLAKAKRPDLGIKILPAIFRGSNAKQGADVLVVLHEHRFVGGRCVHGCANTRPTGEVDDGRAAA